MENINVKEWLEHYRTYAVKVSMSDAMNEQPSQELQLIKQIKAKIDMLIDYAYKDKLSVIDMHYRKGLSYAKIGRTLGYCKTTIHYKIHRGIELIEQVL